MGDVPHFGPDNPINRGDSYVSPKKGLEASALHFTHFQPGKGGGEDSKEQRKTLLVLEGIDIDVIFGQKNQ